MNTRLKDFEEIRRSLGSAVVDETPASLVVAGDSLAQVRRLPDSCVSLILCDPPYHSTKKGNVYGDRAFKEDEQFLGWMEQYASEWKRVLRVNGTLYIFCSAQMSARLEVMMSEYFRPLSHITWTKPNEPGYDGWKGKMKKEALRQWYPHSERILMFEHGAYGSPTATRRSPLGQYLKDCREEAGLSGHTLTEMIGAYGAVNHGGAVSNWECGRNIPSQEQYRRIVEVLEATGGVSKMAAYEDIVRPMAVNGGVEFTDVWNFMSVRPFRDKHPAEKPQDLLMHVIAASSFPGDVVLDCFAGSGSTGVAAIRLGRRAVCIEIEERWIKRGAQEISQAGIEGEHVAPLRVHHAKKARSVSDRLFD